MAVGVVNYGTDVRCTTSEVHAEMGSGDGHTDEGNAGR